MYIVGTVANRAAINDLRAEMRAGFADLSSRMNRIGKRLDTIDTEIRINHDHRLAVLEARMLGRAG